MESFKIVIWIYDLSLRLLVTPVDAELCQFKIETNNTSARATILNYSKDHSWNAAIVIRKFFT